MSEPVLIQQQRAILRALRQANIQHTQITVADAEWQKVLRAHDEVRARLAQVGEEKLLQSAAAATPPAAPSAADPAESFQLGVERVLAKAAQIQELLDRTPTSWRPSVTWKAHGKVTLGLEGSIRVAFSPDGRLLASGSWDKTVKVWEVASGRLLYTLEGHTDLVYSVAFSPDGRLLASGSSDKTVKVWEVASGRLLRTLEGHTSWVWSVAFSPDGHLLASGSKDETTDQTVKVWEADTGRLIHTLRHKHNATSVTFSPDGRLLASGGYHVKVWEVASGRLLRTLEGHTMGVLSVAFSPDGHLLASGSWDKTVKVWEVTSSRLLYTLKGHTGSVGGVAFSPDGRLLASGSDDKTVKIWEVASGHLLQTIALQEKCRSVQFSPVVPLLAVGGESQITLLRGTWPDLPAQVAALAQAKAEAEFWYPRYREQAVGEYQRTLQGQVLAAYQQWQEQFSQSGHPAAFPWQDPAWQDWQPAGSTMGVVRLGAFKA